MKDGRVRAAISIGWKRTENGKVVWHRRVFTGKTRRAVSEQMTCELRDQQRGINIDPTRLTVGEIFGNLAGGYRETICQAQDVPLLRADGSQSSVEDRAP